MPTFIFFILKVFTLFNPLPKAFKWLLLLPNFNLIKLLELLLNFIYCPPSFRVTAAAGRNFDFIVGDTTNFNPTELAAVAVRFNLLLFFFGKLL